MTVNTVNIVDINMTRGSTLAFSFELTGLGQSLDAAYLSCKADLGDSAYVFQKTLGDGIEASGTAGAYDVRIAPEDTADLTPGRYFYDLVVEANNDVKPLMQGALYLVQGVTEPAEE